MDKLSIAIILLIFARTASAQCGATPQGSPAPTKAFSVAPTKTIGYALRLATGEYLAGRANGAHQGVDIVATGSMTRKEDTKVMATGGGIVAFAHNSDPTGYGYTVMIDHNNGEYTLYAHLAETASKPCVKVGDAVHQGQIIGYLFDPATGEKSSGNAASLQGVPAWEHIQVHVELVLAPKGRRSTTTTAPIKMGAQITDPTRRLKDLGY